jgi:hypothetical protein
MLIVPFLKIVVSGLITTVSVPGENITAITRTTMFNTTSIFSKSNTTVETDAEASLPKHMLALSQMEKYGLSLPTWTTPVGAVGQVDLGELSRLIPTANFTATVPLPVMRGDLENCTALTGTNLTLLPSGEIQLPMPATTVPDSTGTLYCVFNGNLANTYSFPENVSFLPPSSPGWFGQLYPPICGGYFIIYGKTQEANRKTIGNITVVQCSSYSLTQ